MLRFIAAAWLALLALPAAAQTFPALTGRVVDQADLLRPEQELDLTSKLEALEKQSGRQFVVATVKSLEGHEISDYATSLGRAWKIGDEQRDDGVVMVVAPNERKVWIATGYGADDVLTDVFTGLVVRQAILPRFKQKPPDYGGGIIAGADAVIAQLQLPPEEARRRAAELAAKEKKREVSVNPIPVIFIVIIFFAIIGSIARRAGGKRYRRRKGGVDPWVILWGLNEISRASRGRGSWGGGSSWGGGGWGGGGGGFSGGGGSFGGGGAGGSW